MPLTWEVPAALVLAWGSVAAVLLAAGRGAASWLAGAGWVWPKTGPAALASAAGLLAGHPGAGLGDMAGSELPGTALVYLLVTLAEVAWLLVTLLGVRAWWRTWGPGMAQGLADRAEVEKVLGLSRLRHDRVVIRPDLYAGPPTPGGAR